MVEKVFQRRSPASIEHHKDGGSRNGVRTGAVLIDGQGRGIDRVINEGRACYDLPETNGPLDVSKVS